MPMTSGQVEAVSVKPLASEDQYGNTHRCAFKVGEDWYSAGSTRGGSYINKNVPELQAGMIVEFMFDINGDFKNVKRPTLSVTGGSPAVPPPSSVQPSSRSAGNTGGATPAVSSAVGMGVGMAINNAILLVANGKIHDSEIEAKACEIYRMAERLKGNAAAGNISKDLEDTRPAVRDVPEGAAEASQRQFDQTFDDDIPF